MLQNFSGGGTSKTVTCEWSTKHVLAGHPLRLWCQYCQGCGAVGKWPKAKVTRTFGFTEHLFRTHSTHCDRDTANDSCVCARWGPRNLTEEQLEQRVQVCKNTVQMSETIPNFLTSIVTCDEPWIHHYDPLSKQQSSVWKHSNLPPPKNFRSSLSVGKVMLLLFFDGHGMSYSTGFPVGRQWTAPIMQTSWKPICEEPWGRKDWIWSRNSGFCSTIMPGHILLLWHWQHWLKMVGQHYNILHTART